MPNIEILDAGKVVNTIVATPDMAEQFYPGAWRIAALQPEPTELRNATTWLIDIGPFFDRFGAAKMAVLTSTDPGVRSILADLQVRKWIDLQRTDVAQGLAYVGSVISAVTTPLQAAILTTPVVEVENLALRKLYFS
ncbi:hypothetical protein [Acidovorax radicis]|uniref:hypothetical protein n=1 Tax=Acidovorax radicis TaxID=758826 RepID=UPI001CFAC2AC|nr:hypothetical protein [Acidovorax radicis]UCV00304.1 hypothetical protein KI609_05835 [Acidovorax radicis]